MIAYLKKFVNSKIGTREMVPLDELARSGKIVSYGSRTIDGQLSLPGTLSNGYVEINCPISINNNTIVTNINVMFSYVAYMNMQDGLSSSASRIKKMINPTCIYDKASNKFRVYLPYGVLDDRFKASTGSTPSQFFYTLSFEYYTYTKFLNS